ncbi:MAG: peptidoglycan-binding protein [Christensenellaceae bacterium]|nr:peptidoglycan-binding protein [Christensenellaceae bacterium]
MRDLFANIIEFFRRLFGGIAGFFADRFGRKKPARRYDRRGNYRRQKVSVIDRIRSLFARPAEKHAPGSAPKSQASFRWNRLQLLMAGAAALLCVVLVVVFAVSGANSPKKASRQAMEVSADAVRFQVTLSSADVVEQLIMTRVGALSLEPGVTHDGVIGLKDRLMELDYLDMDEPSPVYDEITKEAVGLFQRKHGITEDGTANELTMRTLFAADAKVYSVTLGDQGDDVTELQTRLRELGYMESVTGTFGEKTKDAVEQFQKRNELEVSGTVDGETREMLYSADATANALTKGAEGETVSRLQERLAELGYYTGKIDGQYGSGTQYAVRRFQEKNGLIADGWAGPATRELIYSKDAVSSALGIGDKGDDVTKAQKRLKALGYLTKVTGYYGSDTREAVVNFQKRNGLGVDGFLGAKSNAVLFGDNPRKAAPGTAVGTSSGVSRLIAAAESKLGCRYVLGAKGPDRFDCSGLVYWCLRQAGVNQGYMTSYAWRTTSRYRRINSMSDIRKGDIIVYKLGARRGHVGIAVSNSVMIDASSGNGRVVKRSFRSSYWRNSFYCAYRVF